MLLSGCIAGFFKSIIMISASFPGANTSHSSKPRAFAPPSVAIFKTSYPSIQAASLLITFCKVETKYISLNISSALLEAAPSVPIPIFNPAF